MDTSMHKAAPLYRHTQYSQVALVIFGVVLLFLMLLMLAKGFAGLPLIEFVITAVCLVTLTSLTIEVFPDRLILRFGPWLLHKTIWINTICNLRPVQIDPRAGIGIHIFSSIWFYNIGGLEAVELEMKDGQIIRIGTDEPEALTRAIEDAMIDAK